MAVRKPRCLSRRMVEVLAHTANDRTGREQASLLSIAYSTLVHHHEIVHLYLETRSDVAAVAIAVERGWIVRGGDGEWTPNYGVLGS